MTFIKLKRASDNTPIYVNVEKICSIQTRYKGDTTIIDFDGADEKFIEVLEKPKDVLEVIEWQNL